MEINFKKMFRQNAPATVRKFFPYNWYRDTLNNANYDKDQAVKNSVVSAIINFLSYQATLATPRIKSRSTGEYVDDKQLLDLIMCPSSNIDWNMFLEQCITGLIINGSHGVIDISDNVGKGFQYYSYKNMDSFYRVESDKAIWVWKLREGWVEEGESPLEAVADEILTDNYAFSRIYQSLKAPRLGGIVSVTEGGENGIVLTDEQKTSLNKSITDNSEGWFTENGEIKVVEFPERKAPDFVKIHNVSEERICSQFGLPPTVLHFGTGLQTTKVGRTLEQDMRAAWRDGVRPLLKKLESRINMSIMKWYSDSIKYEFVFDTSNIQWYSEQELTIKQNRIIQAKDSELIDEETAQMLLGYDQYS